MASCKVKLFIITLCVGILILIAGCVVGFVVLPNLLVKLVSKSVELKEGTIQWDRFRDIPFPLDFKLNFFHITNPAETLAGEKPIVEIKGPYIYTETRQKIDAKIQGVEAGYKDLLSFQFNGEASAPNKDDDQITVINTPLVALLQSLENAAFELPIDPQKLLDQIFPTPSIFISTKVEDYSFKGITMCDPTRTTHWASMFVCLSAMLMNLRTLKYNEDLSMSFSLLHYKTLPDGPFTCNTGTAEIEDLGLLTSYKGKKYTEFWKGKETSCDAVTGRTSVFAPFVKPEGEMDMYSTDICKTATLHYTGESSFRDVRSYKFQMTQDSYATSEQKNTCVCVGRTRGLDGQPYCYNDGVIDLNNCLGAPIILSFPHLMWTKEEYQNSVIGLKTKEAENNSDNYTTVVEFQPETGFPLRVAINAQMNMVLRPMFLNNQPVELTKNLYPSLFPMLWVQENTELTDELLKELQDQLLNNLVLMDVATWCPIGIGLVLMVVGSACLIYLRCSQKKKNNAHSKLQKTDSSAGI